MKIIHGTDYYDSANYGIDPTITFVRDGNIPQDLNDDAAWPFSDDGCDTYRGINWMYRKTHKRLADLEYGFAFFAGKVYPFLKVMYGDNLTWDNYSNDIALYTKIEYIYDYDEAYFVRKKILGEKSSPVKMHFHFHNYNPTWDSWLIDHNIVTGFYYREKFSRYNNRFGKQHRDTIKHFEINTDCMQEIQFYKVMDSFTANQAVSGFVGGVLPAKSNPMVKLDDKDKIQKAGFDFKKSFRKGKAT